MGKIQFPAESIDSVIAQEPTATEIREILILRKKALHVEIEQWEKENSQIERRWLRAFATLIIVVIFSVPVMLIFKTLVLKVDLTIQFADTFFILLASTFSGFCVGAIRK